MADVSRETSERLSHYEALVRKWSRTINLVAPQDLDQIAARHIADSFQLVPFAKGPHLLDLGSGGGFPGLVLASAKIELRVTLIEADARKAAFLRTASREMGLANVTVLAQRIDAVAPQKADTITARALAPLPELLGHVHRHLQPEGHALLMKGARWRSEVDAARRMWEFTLNATPSSTDPSAAILHVSEIRPR